MRFLDSHKAFFGTLGRTPLEVAAVRAVRRRLTEFRLAWHCGTQSRHHLREQLG